MRPVEDSHLQDQRHAWRTVVDADLRRHDDVGTVGKSIFRAVDIRQRPALLQSRCKLMGLRRMSIGDIKRGENIDIVGASAGSERHRR